MKTVTKPAIIHGILASDYTTPKEVFVQQANYPSLKEITFDAFMYKPSTTNSYAVAVFRVKRRLPMVVTVTGELITLNLL